MLSISHLSPNNVCVCVYVSCVESVECRHMYSQAHGASASQGVGICEKKKLEKKSSFAYCMCLLWSLVWHQQLSKVISGSNAIALRVVSCGIYRPWNRRAQANVVKLFSTKEDEGFFIINCCAFAGKMKWLEYAENVMQTKSEFFGHQIVLVSIHGKWKMEIYCIFAAIIK